MLLPTILTAAAFLSISSVAAVKTVTVESTITTCPCTTAASIFTNSPTVVNGGSISSLSASSPTASSAAAGETCIAGIGTYCDPETTDIFCCSPNSCFFNACIGPGSDSSASVDSPAPVNTPTSAAPAPPAATTSAAAGETCIAGIGTYCDPGTTNIFCCSPNSCFFNACTGP